MRILFSTVDHNSNSYTTKFLKSLEKFNDIEIDVVVVFNGTEVFELTSSSKGEIKYIQTDNHGYFSGIKNGLKNIILENYDYIIICNNDIEINDLRFFDKLQNIKPKGYDVIAPSVSTLDGNEQNPHSPNPPRLLRKIYYRIYFTHYYFALGLYNIRNLIGSKNRNAILNNEPLEREIFSPHGSFIILTPKYFEKGGFIEDGFFLYGEEDSIAGFCHTHGIKILFAPLLKVIHHESATTNKGLNRFKWNHQKLANEFSKKTYPSIYK